MTSFQVDLPTAEYLLLIVLPQTSDLLVLKTDRDTLPSVNIPVNRRPAQEITKTVLDTWGISTVIVDWLPGQNSESNVVLLEVLSPGEPTLCGSLRMLPLPHLPDHLLSKNAHEWLRNILNEEQRASSPLSHIGWI